MDKAGQMVREAMRGAANDAADEILSRGADDIEEAGNFGERWQEALNVNIQETQRTIRLITTMQGAPPVSYWRVFEYGAHIEAKNPSGLMWIPFAGGVFGSTAGGADVWPRTYSGSLFRVGNVLFDARDEQARYFGTPSVTIPQKFHLREIIAKVAKELRSYYAQRMRG
jgi:hypothetical protein